MSRPVGEKKHCCVFHEFQRAVSKAPDKVAVIHALGGARLARERQRLSSNLHIKGPDPNADELPFEEAGSSRRCPTVEGDEYFSFSDVSVAVDSLSVLLRHILDGGDDPHLMKPEGESHSGNTCDVPLSKVSEPFGPSLKLSMSDRNLIMPKIVGLYMAPSVEYIISVLSVLKCGESFLPLDPFWPKEKIVAAVSSSNLDLIISCSSFCEGICSHQYVHSNWLLNRVHCPVLHISMKEILAGSCNSSNTIWPCGGRKQRFFCYVMYTSGSTGKPKGICGTEDGILNRFSWMQDSYPLHGEEHLLFKTSISFIDHLQEFLAAVLTSCTLVIPPASMLKENIFYVLDFLRVYSIDRLIAVPSMMKIVFPALKDGINACIQNTLTLLVLSGEVFPLSLWDSLAKLLPKTSILNLYGSTEVSGDCTYFDCSWLPMILQSESLSSVPIGRPISSCDVVLATEPDTPDHGELFIGGTCVSVGYLSNKTFVPLELVDCVKGLYFKTGDLAKQLQSGHFVFIGRNDRTIKLNAQRISLEEIESTLRRHPDVVDAAVIFRKVREDFSVFMAFVITKHKNMSTNENMKSSVQVWMIEKLRSKMIPLHISFVESFPMSSTGKIDYAILENSSPFVTVAHDEVPHIQNNGLLEVIKKVFCNVLMMEKISDEEDFFIMGGDSISAAHACHCLGIDMRLIYDFPSPSKLHTAILEKQQCIADCREADLGVNVKAKKVNFLRAFNDRACVENTCKSRGDLSGSFNEKTNDCSIDSKRLKIDSNLYEAIKGITQKNTFLWIAKPLSMSCSFGRCNKVICEGEYVSNDVCQKTWVVGCQDKVDMQELWKVHMGSCVDASPTIVYKNGDIFLFIGSHSHIFLCINANSGSVQWKVELEGRIECSATVLSDFSQTIVGCYKGKIYFLDFSNGSIYWNFQTFGEVKAQPVLDSCRHLVWCGSYDHNLYALDYRNYCCAYKLSCGGSICGSPAIDKVHGTLFVASTSGRLTALFLEAFKFLTLWEHELEVPVFGSLSISSLHGMVICCLVDGHVVALDARGSILWKVDAGGPIFAGSCISHALDSQLLICSRNGSIFSFGLETGSVLWEYNVGDPITASAYIDENLELLSPNTNQSDRLVCICSSSGSIHLLRIKLHSSTYVAKEFARLSLHGGIFSSPVMISGRIFVGCRDDFVHCISLEPRVSPGP